MSARTACGDARVLDLDRHLAAVVQRARGRPGRSRRRRSGSSSKLGEHLVERRLELGLDHLAHVVEAHLRGGVAQLAELALELLAVLLGHEADVEERHHLPELHRRALHRPQRGDDLLGRLDVAPLERRLAASLVRAPGWPPGCPSWRARLARRRARVTRAVRDRREVGIRSLGIPERRYRRAGGPAVTGAYGVGAGLGAGVAPSGGAAPGAGATLGGGRGRRRRRRRSASSCGVFVRRRARRRGLLVGGGLLLVGLVLALGVPRGAAARERSCRWSRRRATCRTPSAR